MSKLILLNQVGLGLITGVAAGLVVYGLYRRSKNWNSNQNGYDRHKPGEHSGFLETSARMQAIQRAAEFFLSQLGVTADKGTDVLSRGEPLELMNRLDYVLNSITELRREVDALKNSLHGLAEDIVGEVRSHLEEVQKANRRKRFPHTRERTDSTGSSSIYFTTSSVGPNTDGESEGGYATANAESDFDRESSRGSEEEEHEVSSATVRTMHRDSVVDLATDDEDSMLTTDTIDEELALLLHKADQFHGGDMEQKREGFQLLTTNKLMYGTHQEFLWRLARSYSDMCDLTEDMEEKKSYAFAGKEEAEAALQNGEQSADCHKWFAILCGQQSEHEGIQKQIQTGYLFKEHIEKAISLKPNDSTCYYLLGRWGYEVSNLGWLERKTASALYETPPCATVHEALQNFLKAEQLTPGFSRAARVYIAKCYRDLGNVSTAAQWLKLAEEVPEVTKQDKDSTSFIETALLTADLE